MFKPGQKHTIRTLTTGEGYWYFLGIDFGGPFTAKQVWTLDPETGEAVLYLHKPSKTVYISGGRNGTSNAIHALVQVGPVKEGTLTLREATIIQWLEPGANWRKTKSKLLEHGAKVYKEQVAIR